ncbi:MAG: efflux RND transporter permease subunit [Bacteroidota bacterium]
MSDSPEQLSPDEAQEIRSSRGPIAYMAKNGVAANLLMLFLLAAGLAAYTNIVQEVFPEFSLDAIQVTVRYPGATPEEIEESIIQKIEEQIEAVEGIDEITATASENIGVVTAELQLGTDVSQALDDIKAEVDQIITFPNQAERPEVRELTNRQSVIRIAIYGEASERALKETAYRIEDELSALSEVSFVETSSIRNYEVSIEVPQATLRAYNLSLPQISQAVRLGSLDLPAGNIETSREEIRVRTLGQNYTQQQFEDIVVLSRPDGTTLRLGQIAEVRDDFEDSDLITRYNGQRAAFVEVFRTSDERVLEIVEAVQATLNGEIVPSLPAGINLSIWENNATVLEDRLSLLIRNAVIGLMLVLAALTLFLNIRLAFWSAVGIGIAFVGTLAVMYLMGVSINLLSLFGFILAIGIVVDDAIMVGENIYAERERGAPGLLAALRGGRRIATPVTFAVLTTCAAFTPLLFVPGTLGKIMGSIPVIVISVLLLSLVESLLVLPNHLSHLPDPNREEKNPVFRFFARLQGGVDRQLQRFVSGPLDKALHFATAAPSIIIATAIGLIVLSVALVPAGILQVEFFPEIEGDVVTASLEMPEGTTADQTNRVAQLLEEAGYRAEERLAGERADDAPPLVEDVFASVGQQASGGGPDASNGSTTTQPSIASVQFKLLTAEDRDVSAVRFEDLWREEMGMVPGVRSLTFSSSIIGVGAPVQVELSHPSDQALNEASDRVMEELGRFQGVFDIRSDQDQGTREIQLRLKPAARTLGLTLDDLAQQVRAAFFGAEALRVQRGREDVRVYIRLPERERDAIADVESYRVRTPTGGSVPLRQVATVSFGNAPANIQRKDGRRVVTITANVTPAVITGQEVTARLTDDILPRVQQNYPDLGYQFGGEQEEQAESFGALAQGFLLALFVIYALLAIPFRSYIQPIIIMATIPFGIIGALFGHLLLGISVGLLSIFGIIGLSGVVINDSLVMIDFINERLRRGAEIRDAVIEGAKARFRPILLTSVTTFLGVSPIVFEQSIQAQFLVPMAASIGFGIIFATIILMLFVPAIAMVQLTLTARLTGRAPQDQPGFMEGDGYTDGAPQQVAPTPQA